jgi:hypothetical protein
MTSQIRSSVCVIFVLRIPFSESSTMAQLSRPLQLCLVILSASRTLGLAVRSSQFLGTSLEHSGPQRFAAEAKDDVGTGSSHALVMRKQKASDRRTRRRQRGIVTEDELLPLTVTESPMKAAGPWRGKAIQPDFRGSSSSSAPAKAGGRGRSKKRSTLYNSLSFYHNHFLSLLTHEYQVEVSL